ncbi:ABC transporter permease subunit [Eubacteriales bacterium OttesenSCG-928-A19]|nr:ABC transporter permease subunit [Eubacteriales bacterium OttesenSCG-928-A19]
MLRNVWNILTTRSDFFLQLTMEHLAISMISILLACVLGLLLGIFISEYRKASKVVLTIVNIIYTIPSISLLGFLIPFSGIGNTTAIIALTIYALLPMVRNTHTGLTNIEPSVIEAARGMGSTDAQILYKVKLPLALPVIMTGLRSMVIMTIALAGIASFIGAGGLGVAIYRGITTNNTAMTIAGSLLIALLAFVLDFLLGLVEKSMQRHGAWKRGAVVVLCIVLVVCLIFGALSLGGGEDTVRVATKPMTEQYLLGEMLTFMIEQDTDLTVELTQGVGGGTSNIQPAMEKGEFDLYPEYTGTGWNDVLKMDTQYDEGLFPELEAQYRERFDMEWVGMYGFNNTFGLAVRKEIADQYGLKTYSDLAAVSDQLVFGAEYDFFERGDGYDPLVERYGFRFARTVDLDIGLKYQAIDQGEIDVMVIFTTDGQLSTADITVLEDNLGFYPSYLCGNVVRGEALTKHPELRDVLLRLQGVLSDSDMARLNYLVEGDGQEPREVARTFLVEKGLLQEGV